MARLSIGDVTHSVQRLLVTYHPTPEQAQQYVSMLLEAMGWMDPHRFELVCIEMLTDVKAGRLPVPGAYIATYRKLDEKYGWSKKDKATKPKCDGCGGFGFVYQTMIHTRFEMSDRFVKPCPMCRPNHPHALLPDKRDWVVAEHDRGGMKATSATVRFIQTTFDLPIDYSKSPESVLEEFMDLWRAGPLKRRGAKSPEGDALAALRPAVPDKPVTKEFWEAAL